MRVKFSNKGTTLIARLSGELDHHTAGYAREKIDGEIMKSTTKNLILDFSDIAFMDSSGIGVIMGRYKNMIGIKGGTAVVSSNGRINRMLEMAGIVKMIPVFEKFEDALDSFMNIKSGA